MGDTIKCFDGNHLVSKLTGESFGSLEDLHNHIRKFKVKRADYYQEFYPRFDKLTKDRILFKEYEQYFTQEFKDKNSLKKWLNSNIEEGKIWAANWLSVRKKEKNLKYLPTQAELRSLFCPSMPYYDKMFEGGYYGLGEKLGFAKRYEDKKLTFTSLPKSCEIIIDTREQKPVIFPSYIKTKVAKVDEGDYSLDEKNDKKIYIERKGLSDFTGTLSIKNLPRFRRELDRAVKNDEYIIMVVEDTIANSLSFNYLPHMRHVKASPSFIFHNLRQILNDYPDNFQIVFTDGRVEMSRVILRIFELGEQAKKVDLQFKYENKEL